MRQLRAAIDKQAQFSCVPLCVCVCVCVRESVRVLVSLCLCSCAFEGLLIKGCLPKLLSIIVGRVGVRVCFCSVRILI